ncbi:MAG: type II toxin-antitoxin system PemK/MazF family toxin [Burkholderiaceae bacterium]|nr:type II toxin-antitoxin system PemK/MazF family toxin [Burkholderiaceae bacterium]MEB2320090.1 type II toxin-antitoxin system PemK/MazF family toxin [Pseudomonadota bacterium]
MAASAPPEVGQVIRHAYLWHSEARRGQEEGLKDRPCVVVHRRLNAEKLTEVFICPITHSPPQDPERAIELPGRTKARLKLDAERQWIITTEINRFIWPGPDIRRAPDGSFSYGLLPGGLARATAEQVQKNARDRSIAMVERPAKPD